MTPVIEHPITIQNPIAKTWLLKGFLSFNEFVGARLVKIVYVAGSVLIVLGTIGSGLVWGALYLYWAIEHYFSFALLVSNFIQIVLGVIGSIILCALGILLLRLYCELLLAIFKINENLQAVRNQDVRV